MHLKNKKVSGLSAGRNPDSSTKSKNDGSNMYKYIDGAQSFATLFDKVQRVQLQVQLALNSDKDDKQEAMIKNLLELEADVDTVEAEFRGIFLKVKAHIRGEVLRIYSTQQKQQSQQHKLSNVVVSSIPIAHMGKLRSCGYHDQTQLTSAHERNNSMEVANVMPSSTHARKAKCALSNSFNQAQQQSLLAALAWTWKIAKSEFLAASKALRRPGLLSTSSQRTRKWYAKCIVQRGTYLSSDQLPENKGSPAFDISTDGEKLYMCDFLAGRATIYPMLTRLAVEQQSVFECQLAESDPPSWSSITGFAFVPTVGCVWHDTKSKRVVVCNSATLTEMASLSVSYECQRSRIVPFGRRRFLVLLCWRSLRIAEAPDVYEYKYEDHCGAIKQTGEFKLRAKSGDTGWLDYQYKCKLGAVVFPYGRVELLDSCFRTFAVLHRNALSWTPKCCYVSKRRVTFVSDERNNQVCAFDVSGAQMATFVCPPGYFLHAPFYSTFSVLETSRETVVVLSELSGELAYIRLLHSVPRRQGQSCAPQCWPLKSTFEQGEPSVICHPLSQLNDFCKQQRRLTDRKYKVRCFARMSHAGPKFAFSDSNDRVFIVENDIQPILHSTDEPINGLAFIDSLLVSVEGGRRLTLFTTSGRILHRVYFQQNRARRGLGSMLWMFKRRLFIASARSAVVHEFARVRNTQQPELLLTGKRKLPRFATLECAASDGDHFAALVREQPDSYVFELLCGSASLEDLRVVASRINCGKTPMCTVRRNWCVVFQCSELLLVDLVSRELLPKLRCKLDDVHAAFSYIPITEHVNSTQTDATSALTLDFICYASITDLSTDFSIHLNERFYTCQVQLHPANVALDFRL